MNVFVILMLVFAALGLLDEILGGRLGFMPDFEKGLSTMGGLAMSTVGFYAIGISYVQSHAEAFAAAAEHMPFDPSLIVGCLLAPDMGAMGIAQKLAASASIAIFTGSMVSGGLGATVGYQLPVFLAAVKKEEIPELMRGFIFGLIMLPFGLTASELSVNMIPVLALCAVLIAAFLLIPAQTTRFLIILGNGIRILSFLFFGIAIFSVFVPRYAVVDSALVTEMLDMVLRMVIVACGGLVVSHIALDKLRRPIEAIGRFLGVNNESVVGLFLSCTQSLAMLPLFTKMDRRGRILNAAFSVAGAYVVGGQMAFVASLIPPKALTAYMANKMISGILAVALAVFCDKRQSLS